MLVIKAILELPNDNIKYFEQLQQYFSQLLPLINNYIKNNASQLCCLYGIEEFCLQNPFKLTYINLSRIINYLYFSDVIEEEVILNWYEFAKPLEKFDVQEQQQLRSHAAIKAFINWLKDAETESSCNETEI